MDDEFLTDYFIKLNEEISNPRFIDEFKNQIDDLNEDKLKELIKNHY
ncbi:hypothetical protein [Methanobrevibacter millerae]|uniref:Uncharacterized protein n=1 Tax=Methanobrevibacter millerae TaxID=230361 RepID=A0A1G5WHD3_9EURY|nr:hypothetical protein [Methanobrevibacter millerae]SDA57304.1 hypothetical protein SAMN02910315_01402 [Methanobrevibacter millerae]